MNLKKIKIQELIPIIDIRGLCDEQIYQNSQELAKKIVNVEKYIKLINIQIVVKNLNSSLICLRKDEVIEVLNKDQYYLIRSIYYKNEIEMQDVDIYITLIESKEHDNLDYYIFDCLIKLSNFFDGGKVNFSTFESKMKKIIESKNKKLSNYVIGARKSLFKTIFNSKKIKLKK